MTQIKEAIKVIDILEKAETNIPDFLKPERERLVLAYKTIRHCLEHYEKMAEEFSDLIEAAKFARDALEPICRYALEDAEETLKQARGVK